MERLFLVTNPGSSSRKYALYRGRELIVALHFEFEDGKVVCTVKTPDGKRKKLDGYAKLTETVKYVEKILVDEGYLDANNKLDAVLARVAASGDYFTRDHKVDEECLRELELAKKRTPLHVPVVAAEIEACIKQFDNVPVIAISDSSFHATRDQVRSYYAINTDLADKLKIKRYGYHGLSMGSIVEYLKSQDLLEKKMVICHLGSGASITAIQDGKSVDTTMGYTPLPGLMMATRSGDIDPAVSSVIGRELKLDAEGVETYLNKECGLKGVAGTDDLREVIALRDDGDAKAKLAYEMFIYRIQTAIGQMAASLQGMDGLVITATIGERNSEVRRDIVAGLAYLGFKINDTKNADGLDGERCCLVSGKNSKPIYVIMTDETGEMIRRAELTLD